MLGTALASTLLIGVLLSPSPARAVVNCPPAAFPPPGPISIVNPGDDIVCTNVYDRSNNAGTVISLATSGANEYISLDNSGNLTITSAGGVLGIFAVTNGGSSAVDIVNSSYVTAYSGTIAFGIRARSVGANSPVTIVNSGDVTATGNTYNAFGLHAYSYGAGSDIAIWNSGGVTAISNGNNSVAAGIYARPYYDDSTTEILNSGDLLVMASGAGAQAFGIYVRTGTVVVEGVNTPVAIVNSGDITVTTSGSAQEAYGIYVRSGFVFGDNSPVNVANSGDFAVTSADSGWGINAATSGDSSPLVIVNAGRLMVTTANSGFGIDATTFRANSPLSVDNSGDISVSAAGFGIAIRAHTFDPNNPVSIVNSGDLAASGVIARGVDAYTSSANSPIDIMNSGKIVAGTGILAKTSGSATGGGSNSGIAVHNTGDIVSNGVVNAGAIYTATLGAANGNHSNVGIAIDNSGDLTAVRGGIVAGVFGSANGVGSNAGVAIANAGKISGLYGIYAVTKGNANGAGSNVGIDIGNSGDITAGTTAILARVYGSADGAGSNASIHIENSGSVFGGTGAGIYAYANTAIAIVNTGYVSASSLLAINTNGAGNATIYNAGLITGFVVLDANDIFINQKGGVFETKLTSYFGLGSDLFVNEQGGTVLAATNPSVKETSGFEGLERFENKGLITLQDDAIGDVFFIANSYGATPEFVGSGKSELAIDAFLGGPGSAADNLIIDGNVSGKTKVDVNNTNAGPGVFNKVGIPVVFVGGNVKSDAFFLSQPIDTGFFDYDLFFKPTGSGIFELKSFLGQGAFVLPQLITAAQDMWHSGSSTWFDRTADLRVLLNGGAAPAEDPNAKYAEGTPAPQNITPAVWARGSGDFLNRDDSERVTAYGRDYSFNLNRDLQTVDFQSGIDLGKRGLLSDNDILVFGALGGFIHSDLDYDAINRIFSFNGGQVGGYATYLRGGLFVDALVNVHLMQLDTRTLGFPNSLNTTTVGVRTDSGYRFGSFHGGAFIEPLATISVDWADIDGFSQGGNKVSFNNDANVQGRLGLRVGTTTQLWPRITVEPFVIGSLWGNLSNDNQATLVSTGTTFILEDHLEDVWGEVSAGVNFFNPTASTSVFAKVDVTFGEDTDGVGGKAGMRVSW